MKVKNITLNADEHLIELARKKAHTHHVSLNYMFRQWLTLYVGRKTTEDSFTRMMKNLSYADSGKKFTRDELNER